MKKTRTAVSPAHLSQKNPISARKILFTGNESTGKYKKFGYRLYSKFKLPFKKSSTIYPKNISLHFFIGIAPLQGYERRTLVYVFYRCPDVEIYRPCRTSSFSYHAPPTDSPSQ